jgi:hypothetical protein
MKLSRSAEAIFWIVLNTLIALLAAFAGAMSATASGLRW